MVLQQLDGDVAIGQQLHIVVELSSRNGAGALALYLGGAGSTETQSQISSRDSEPIVPGLEQEVGEDRNRGFAFHDALGGSQFSKQLELADADFHPCSLDRSGCSSCHLVRLLSSRPDLIVGSRGREDWRIRDFCISLYQIKIL